MRHRICTAMLLVGALSLVSVGVGAQREGHPESEATQPKDQTPTQPGTAGPGMMGMMMNMMGRNQQMSDNMNKMMENMAALQNEKDPAKMKSMMMQQSAMLEQMRSQMMQQGGMMQNVSGTMMKSCPMTGAEAKPSTK
jgi:hypothetical protein